RLFDTSGSTTTPRSMGLGGGGAAGAVGTAAPSLRDGLNRCLLTITLYATSFSSGWSAVSSAGWGACARRGAGGGGSGLDRAASLARDTPKNSATASKSTFTRSSRFDKSTLIPWATPATALQQQGSRYWEASSLTR